MFQHSTRLPHLLAPARYRDVSAYAQEVNKVLLPAWHMVATTRELAQSGDFITCDLLGTPIQIRNFGGELKALSNVCAHRHCLISSQPRGRSARMACQYHGWEYQANGCTGKIPQPKNFAPYEEISTSIPTYRLETCGQLIFVSLATEGLSLREHLGDQYEVLARRFGNGWQQFLQWNPDYAANWKVPIENTLEAYHVPFVHPQTFREDPGAERSTHVLDPLHTSFSTQLPFSPHSRLDRMFQQCEQWLMRRLGEPAQGRYEQHHCFPTLLFSFTDVVSLVQSIIPTGTQTCRAVVRQFGNVGQSARGLWHWVALAWGKLEAMISQSILREDMAMFAKIQHGLNASTVPGMLGACEERIWAFQRYVAEKCSNVYSSDDSTMTNLIASSEVNA